MARQSWHLLTKHGGSGNPFAATAEKGRQLVELIVERLSGFLVELSDADVMVGHAALVPRLQDMCSTLSVALPKLNTRDQFWVL